MTAALLLPAHARAYLGPVRGKKGSPRRGRSVCLMPVGRSSRQLLGVSATGPQDLPRRHVCVRPAHQRGHYAASRRHRPGQPGAADHRQGRQGAARRARRASTNWPLVVDPPQPPLVIPQPTGDAASISVCIAHLRRAARAAGVQREAARPAPQLCDQVDRERRRHPYRAGPARPRQHRHKAICTT